MTETVKISIFMEIKFLALPLDATDKRCIKRGLTVTFEVKNW